MSAFADIIARAAGAEMSHAEALQLAECDDLSSMMSAAEQLTVSGFGHRVTYSRKVFIPLTHLCRDVCHYCTFARAPRKGERAYMTIDEVVQVAQAGAAAGCKEALFTLGDKPEMRFRAAREDLQRLGFVTTVECLGSAAKAVIERTDLLPHLNCGVMTAGELHALRPVAVSMGLMLESTARRRCVSRAAFTRTTRAGATSTSLQW